MSITFSTSNKPWVLALQKSLNVYHTLYWPHENNTHSIIGVRVGGAIDPVFFNTFERVHFDEIFGRVHFDNIFAKVYFYDTFERVYFHDTFERVYFHDTCERVQKKRRIRFPAHEWLVRGRLKGTDGGRRTCHLISKKKMISKTNFISNNTFDFKEEKEGVLQMKVTNWRGNATWYYDIIISYYDIIHTEEIYQFVFKPSVNYKRYIL